MAKSHESLGIRIKPPIVPGIAQSGVITVLFVLKVGLEHGRKMDVAFDADVIIKIERSVEGQSLKVSARILIFV